MDKRIWLRGRANYSPEEIADIMYLTKRQKSMIADGQVQVIEEDLLDNGGHIFKYVTDKRLSDINRHGDYVKKFNEDLNDSQRVKVVESMFNMHKDEVLRLRKKSGIKPTSRNVKKKCRCK